MLLYTRARVFYNFPHVSVCCQHTHAHACSTNFPTFPCAVSTRTRVLQFSQRFRVLLARTHTRAVYHFPHVSVCCYKHAMGVLQFLTNVSVSCYMRMFYMFRHVPVCCYTHMRAHALTRYVCSTISPRFLAHKKTFPSSHILQFPHVPVCCYTHMCAHALTRYVCSTISPK